LISQISVRSAAAAVREKPAGLRLAVPIEIERVTRRDHAQTAQSADLLKEVRRLAIEIQVCSQSMKRLSRRRLIRLVIFRATPVEPR
jgi:hypothetical protein